jgi:predicted transcriptional regulator
MKYRSRGDIVGLLLDAANGGDPKTKLVYKAAYLSSNQLRKYLALLVENGLIKYEGGQRYRTTDYCPYRTKSLPSLVKNAANNNIC